MAVPADSTLQAIYTKIRQLTRSPSEAVLRTQDIDQQINTFILYDFPEHLRLFSLKTTFSFFTQPLIDSYGASTVPSNPLFEFYQTYISLEPPVYIAGYEASYTQSRSEFYRIFPFVNSVANTQITGTGNIQSYSGILSAKPVLRNQVTFTALDASGAGLVLSDDGNGNLTSPDGTSTGTINYVTGAFTLNWTTAVAQGASIFSETYPYSPGRPTMMLFYDNVFTFRPVPDLAYKVTIDAYIRPTQLLATNQSPQLQQWWQYIAYGAAKKIFENRMDLDSVALITPEFNKQERLVLRTTLVQQANQRVPTIYTINNQSNGYNPYGNQW